MAIPHAHVGIGKKGKAAPHADYIMREGKYAEYAERKGDHLVAVESGNMPQWAVDNPREFWKAADQYERANGTTYREFEFALPRELDRDQRLALVREWAKDELGDKHAYTFAIHEAKAADGGIQPHVHMMFSERQQDGIERSPEQYFKRANKAHPERGGCAKGYGKNAGKTLTASERSEELKALRGRWQSLTNLRLRRAGHEASEISLVSYKDSRSLKTPEPKMKPSEWHKPNSPKREALLAAREERAEIARQKQEARELTIKINRTRESVMNSDPKRKALAWEFSGTDRVHHVERICADYEALKKREADVKRSAFNRPDNPNSKEGYVVFAERHMKRTERNFLYTEQDIKKKGIFGVLTAEGRRLRRELESHRKAHFKEVDEYNKQYGIFEEKIKPIHEKLKELQPEYEKAKAYLDQQNDIQRALEKVEGSPEHKRSIQQQKQAAENAKKEAKEAAERKIREEQIKDAARRRGIGGMKM